MLRLRQRQLPNRPKCRVAMLCVGCGWSQECSGTTRPLEHLTHQVTPSLEAVAQWVREQGIVWTPASEAIVRNYRFLFPFSVWAHPFPANWWAQPRNLTIC